jgi:ABC-type multidrug transport system ATPase subunit
MRQVLEMVGLWERRKSLVNTFSGGMKRRLEIARGLMHSPRVLFLDEPTVGLDPQTRSSIWSYIRELKAREDITIFLTTHYMDEAEYCDRIAIMDKGVIVVLDTPDGAEGVVGKDRVQIQTDDDEAAIAALRERFEIEATARRGRGHLRRARASSSCRGCSPSSDRADPLGQRLAPLARRRVHVLHRHHDPRRRGRRPTSGANFAMMRPR